MNESVDGYDFPDFTGNNQMKKWFNEGMPILLKAEFSKIKMHLQAE